ncbi:MAG: phytanoyl-CoA dioxygenase family protein [Niveispirillum sp.]|uniref:phytanoyl-CoA dioxygenase family protein n=1 Tax=Niveispirillum sp. TaxID=1917217 RepID=UPI0040374BF2
MNVAVLNSPLTAQDLVTPDFWLAINPDLHVMDLPFINATTPFNIGADLARKARELVVREGYFHLPGPIPWRLSIEAMRNAVGHLKDRGLSPVFAYAYDEFWVIFARLHHLIKAILGDDYMLLPDFWAWHVDPRAGEAGWSPHRDKGQRSLFPDGTPKSLTIWLPLSNANPLNGCMYVLPADRDKTYHTDNEWQWAPHLPDIRALPATAGDVFCWNQAVLHWGARSSPRATEPRVSIAFEFQLAKVEPFNQPLMKALTIPSMDSRISLICKQIVQYKHMYPLSPELEALAMERLSTSS